MNHEAEIAQLRAEAAAQDIAAARLRIQLGACADMLEQWALALDRGGRIDKSRAVRNLIATARATLTSD